MSKLHRRPRAALRNNAGPTRAELTAIEAEWSLIAAELALVDAEVAALAAGSAVSELARRRVRRAEVRVAVEARSWAGRRAGMTAEAAA
ncbi:hypothetical protein CLV92_108129 [Kineococcus xinjiangensis]|uniref:Uncharacterized protein n=1 Tax=Kineococcus xinjiangensis TaxID=512762 RepID=A0A2S6IJ29_9ACTN|nr:DUF6284 family protein [Kineococcus xinjiangensis]PPK94227.1 hypothetical protein CLV92_108129 [Kineococcus xinjiangensis]